MASRHDRSCRLNPEPLRRGEKRIRAGFPGRLLTDRVCHDAHLKEVIQRQPVNGASSDLR